MFAKKIMGEGGVKCALAVMEALLYLFELNTRAIALLIFVQHVDKISLFLLSISVVPTVVANRASSKG